MPPLRPKIHARPLLIAIVGMSVFLRAQADAPPNPFDFARARAFTYNADGTVHTETIEPSQGADCVVKTYGYDPQGNLTSTAYANCPGAVAPYTFAARSDGRAYAAQAATFTANGVSVTVNSPAGVGLTSVSNALSQTETDQFDPRFGLTLSSKDPNGLTTTYSIDDFGRTVRKNNPDHTSEVTFYCYLTAAGQPDNSQTSRSPGCPSTLAAAEAPPGAALFIQTEIHDANDVKEGPFSRSYRDRLGRQMRQVTQSYDGADQPASYRGALIAQDQVYGQYGAKTLETRNYFLYNGSSATSGSNDVGVTATVTDILGRIVKSYRADAHGSTSFTFGGSGTVAYGVYGTRAAAVESTTYVGQTSTVTNDLNHARIDEHGANGEVRRTTDANGAQLALQYDAFGNLVKAVDALQNVTTISYDYEGRKLLLADLDKGTTNYTYDALGEMASQTNANGKTASYSYDVTGRITSRVEPESSVSWYFDTYRDGSACVAGIGKICEVYLGSGLDRKYVYDTAGRLVNRRVDTGSGTPSFAFSRSFSPTSGKVTSVVFPTGLQINYNYTTEGLIQSLTMGAAGASVTSLPGTQSPSTLAIAPGQLIWKPTSIDAQGRYETTYTLGGLSDRTAYDPASGHVLSMQAGAGTASDLMNQSYTWDSIGNMVARVDANGDGTTGQPQSGSVTESFLYDNVNRLRDYTVSASGIPGLQREVVLNYNSLGMLLYKSDVGIYSYGASGSAHPHFPVSVAGATLTTYSPDADGNLLNASAGKYSQLSYSSFDEVATATGPAGQYAWLYDEDHARIKETRLEAGNTRVVWYMNPDAAGKLEFEYETDTATTPAYSARHYLSVDDQTVAVLVSGSALPALAAGQTAPTVSGSPFALNKIEFWHRDQLGSITSTSDHAGRLTERYSYDPFGKRRFPYGAYDSAGSIVYDWAPGSNFGTGRGFTGHEELDDIGLVNMNGRIYDANLGVFMQADPRVADGLNLQHYNRYGYVSNNPLNATDPSGFDASGTGDSSGDGGDTNGGDIKSYDLLKVEYKPVDPMMRDYVGSWVCYGECYGLTITEVGGTGAPGQANGSDAGAFNNSPSSDPATQSMNAPVEGSPAVGTPALNGVPAGAAPGATAAEGASPTAAAAAVTENRLSGNAYRDAVEKALKSAGYKTAQEVRLVWKGAEEGAYAVMDVIGVKDGRIVLIEAKDGLTAKLSPAQKALFEQAFKTGDVRIVSAEAAERLGLTAGKALAVQGELLVSVDSSVLGSRAGNAFNRIAGKAAQRGFVTGELLEIMGKANLFLELMLHSEGLGGCDSRGVCMDEVDKTPKFNR